MKSHNPEVQKMDRRGALPAVRIGRRVRIKRSDLDAVVDANCGGPTRRHPQDFGREISRRLTLLTVAPKIVAASDPRAAAGRIQPLGAP